MIIVSDVLKWLKTLFKNNIFFKIFRGGPLDPLFTWGVFHNSRPLANRATVNRDILEPILTIHPWIKLFAYNKHLNPKNQTLNSDIYRKIPIWVEEVFSEQKKQNKLYWWILNSLQEAINLYKHNSVPCTVALSSSLTSCVCIKCGLPFFPYFNRPIYR